MISPTKHKGFTLIELLVVIAIIGVLATVVLSSLNTARARARDAKRLSEMKSLETALELYYLDNGRYPPLGSSHTENGNLGATSLQTAIAPYMKIDLLGPYYRDASGGNAAVFYYSSPVTFGFQSYGMMVRLENSVLNANDGGYASFGYELGPDPRYCKNTYPMANNGSWWHSAQRCVGGN
jgi:prepilin-type N-terminal cleavage/methylation domain-containing protein